MKQRSFIITLVVFIAATIVSSLSAIGYEKMKHSASRPGTLVQYGETGGSTVNGGIAADTDGTKVKSGDISGTSSTTGEPAAFSETTGDKTVDVIRPDATVDTHAHDYVFNRFIWTANDSARAECFCTVGGETAIFSAAVTATVTKAPTCDCAGVKTYTATYKGNTDSKTQSIAASGHDFEVKRFVWEGFTAKAICVCARCEQSNVADALVFYAVTAMPTTGSEGTATYYATFDGNSVTKTETLKKLDVHADFDEDLLCVDVSDDREVGVIRDGTDDGLFVGAASAKAYDDPIYGYRKNLAGAYAGIVEPDYYIETSDRQNYKIVESINWFYVQTDPRLKGSGLSKPAKRLPGAAGDGSFALSRKILVRKLE